MRKHSSKPINRLPIRKRTNATERKGIAVIRDVVENANSVFKEIDRANDYGHDAFVLLVDGEEVTPVEIAIQIKAGRSYCSDDRCNFAATAAQLNFWARHPFVTLGVVCDPDSNCSWWVNLREVARAQRNKSKGKSISFQKSDYNKFNDNGFQEVILPALLGESPRIGRSKALVWLSSDDRSTHDLGARVLLERFSEDPATWDSFLSQFCRRGRNSSFSILRGLVRIMGHPDEGYYSDEIPRTLRDSIRQKITNFGKLEVIELLHFVDDCGFERGSPGYGLFAIVPRIKDGFGVVHSIASDKHQPQSIIDNASLLLAIQRDDPDWWALWKTNSTGIIQS